MGHFYFTHPQPLFATEIYSAVSDFERQGWEFVSLIRVGAAPKASKIQTTGKTPAEPAFLICIRKPWAEGENKIDPPQLNPDNPKPKTKDGF